MANATHSVKIQGPHGPLHVIHGHQIGERYEMHLSAGTICVEVTFTRDLNRSKGCFETNARVSHGGSLVAILPAATWEWWQDLGLIERVGAGAPA